MVRASFRAVDIFSGCGGLSAGLERAGFQIVAALDSNPSAAKTYRLNFPSTKFFQGDVRSFDLQQLMSIISLRPGELDLLAGCPPCQGFSRLKTLNGFRSCKDEQNDLIFTFCDFVEVFRPKAVLLENVPGLAHDERFTAVSQRLLALGYKFDWSVLNAANFSVSQIRRRFVLAAAVNFQPTLVEGPFARKSVRDAIGHLHSPGLGTDHMHDYKDKRTEHVEQIIRAIPANGGSRTDLPNQLQLACHRKTDGFRDVYGRMSWDKPSPTITGGCINPSKGRFLHPDQNRAITLREASLLQGFPPDFLFARGGKYELAQMIGNAFPPPFAELQAAELRRHLSLR